jgi:hypothetical protein
VELVLPKLHAEGVNSVAYRIRGKKEGKVEGTGRLLSLVFNNTGVHS